MRVVVAHRAVDLAEYGDSGNALACPFQAMHHVGHFLAQRAGRGSLAMGAAQHRHFGKLVRMFAHAFDHSIQRGQHHLIAAVFQHQRVGEVVDIFRGAGKVDELQLVSSVLVVCQLLAQPVFNRLHIVIGAALDGFDLLGIGFTKLRGELVQFCNRRSRKWR